MNEWDGRKERIKIKQQTKWNKQQQQLLQKEEGEQANKKHQTITTTSTRRRRRRRRNRMDLGARLGENEDREIKIDR